MRSQGTASHPMWFTISEVRVAGFQENGEAECGFDPDTWVRQRPGFWTSRPAEHGHNFLPVPLTFKRRCGIVDWDWESSVLVSRRVHRSAMTAVLTKGYQSRPGIQFPLAHCGIISRAWGWCWDKTTEMYLFISADKLRERRAQRFPPRRVLSRWPCGSDSRQSTSGVQCRRGEDLASVRATLCVHYSLVYDTDNHPLRAGLRYYTFSGILFNFLTVSFELLQRGPFAERCLSARLFSGFRHVAKAWCITRGFSGTRGAAMHLAHCDSLAASLQEECQLKSRSVGSLVW